MYICKNCFKTIKPNTHSFLYTTKSRLKNYPIRRNANIFKKDGRIKQSDDPGGTGYESEKDIRVCPDCYKQLTSDN